MTNVREYCRMVISVVSVVSHDSVSMVSYDGVNLWYHAIVLIQSIQRWGSFVVSCDSFNLWYHNMVFNMQSSLGVLAV